MSYADDDYDDDDRDRYDDDDRDRYDDDRPRFPIGVMIAGCVWIGVGGLQLLNMLATFALVGMNQGAPGQAGGACCSGFIGIAFLVCGFQTVTGSAKDTLGNSIGSILLGLLQLVLAAAIGFGGMLLQNPGGNPNPGQPQLPAGVLMIVAVVVGMFGTMLITAGILALAGRTSYKEWRRANRRR